jgi:hypothetical protein
VLAAATAAATAAEVRGEGLVVPKSHSFSVEIRDMLDERGSSWKQGNRDSSSS